MIKNIEHKNLKDIFLKYTIYLILFPGFFFYQFMDMKNPVDADLKEEEKQSDKQSSPVGRKMLVLVILMIFFFFYVGLEVAFGTFLTTFAVKCKLGNLLSIFRSIKTACSEVLRKSC